MKEYYVNTPSLIYECEGCGRKCNYKETIFLCEMEHKNKEKKKEPWQTRWELIKRIVEEGNGEISGSVIFRMDNCASARQWAVSEKLINDLDLLVML